MGKNKFKPLLPSNNKEVVLRLLGGLVLFAIALTGTDHFFMRHNKGFCIWQIYSSHPAEGPWDIRDSSCVSSEQLQELFSQPFSYLGKGHQSIAFESSDKKYVLKLYKFPSHMRRGGWVARPFSRFTEKRKAIRIYNEKKFNATKASHRLAFSSLKEECGLIAIHMSKSTDCPYEVHLVDPLKMHYKVSLKDTFFVLQKKGELIFPTLSRYVKNGEIKEAKRIIDNTLSFLVKRSSLGIQDTDAILEKNYGLFGSSLFQLDTGSLRVNPSIKSAEDAKIEALKVTEPLKNWLSKVSPELLEYYIDKAEKI